MALLPDNMELPRARCAVHESMLAGTRSLIMDNGVLTLSLLPQFGARLCSLFYRPANLELLATEFIRDAHNGLHVHGGWCAAFPSLLADGEIISHIGWDAEIVENTPESAVVRAWCLVDQVSSMREGRVRMTPATILVERFIRLQAGKPEVLVEEVLTNRTVQPIGATWSGVISLRAQAGDRVVLPVESVEIQRGIGPSGNELDFGLLVTTPYQAMARDLREGWLGFRLSRAPVDVRLTFPRDLLPHAVIGAQRDANRPAEDVIRLQPLATPGPTADDTRGGALVLPARQPLSLPLRLEVGSGILTGGDWSRPGLQLAELITAQRVPAGRAALWRVGRTALMLKTSRYLAALMPEITTQSLLTPEDLPTADLLLFGVTPANEALARLAHRTSSRFIGPAQLRQHLLELGIGEDRSVAISPGARFDIPALGVLATPARNENPDEQLGFLVQADHLLCYHPGNTQFLGEFGPIGEQFHPQLVFLPLDGMSLGDAVLAAKLLQPRLVIPLGDEQTEHDFAERCRAQHMSFATRILSQAEGAFFDGWRLHPLVAGE